MVTFVTGPVNSGKTTKMAAIFREKGGDGILCPKYLENGIHRGYDLLHLATGNRIPFIRRRDAQPENWHEAFSFGPWSFAARGQEISAEIIGNAIETGTTPVFLDEIGPIELKDRGFAPLFRILLKTETEQIVSVRDFLLEDIINFFEIKNYQIYKEKK